MDGTCLLTNKNIVWLYSRKFKNRYFVFIISGTLSSPYTDKRRSKLFNRAYLRNGSDGPECFAQHAHEAIEWKGCPSKSKSVEGTLQR